MTKKNVGTFGRSRLMMKIKIKTDAQVPKETPQI